MWNYCTYDVKLITKLSFDIFDVDRIGKLEACECDALLRMVYDVDDLDEIEGPPSGVELLAEIDVNGDGYKTKRERKHNKGTKKQSCKSGKVRD